MEGGAPAEIVNGCPFLGRPSASRTCSTTRKALCTACLKSCCPWPMGQARVRLPGASWPRRTLAGPEMPIAARMQQSERSPRGRDFAKLILYNDPNRDSNDRELSATIKLRLETTFSHFEWLVFLRSGAARKRGHGAQKPLDPTPPLPRRWIKRGVKIERPAWTLAGGKPCVGCVWSR
jgi:hypothetical protein